MFSMLSKYAYGMLLALACILTTGASTQVAAADFNLKMHNTWVESRTESKLIQKFSDEILRKSAGRLNITVYHGGSLGIKDVDILRTLPAGAVDIAAIYPGYLSRDAPVISFLYPNIVLGSVTDHEKVRPMLREMYARLFEKFNIQMVGAFELPTYDVTIMCREPVHTLSQLRGKKLRVTEALAVDAFSRVGVSAQTIPQSDLYLAMQTGVVDCAVYPVSLAVTISLQEVARYASTFSVTVGTPTAIVFNKKTWDTLPKDLQEIVKSVGNGIYDQSIVEGNTFESEKELVAKLVNESKLVALEPFSQADRNAIRDAHLTAWKEKMGKIGPDALALYNAITAAYQK